MRLPDPIQRRLHRGSLPGALLIALLQRTPAGPVAMVAEEFVLSSPIGQLLRSAVTAAASLGALHSLAGATQLSVSPNQNPGTATVGTAKTIVFTVAGAQAAPGSWTVGGSVPPGMVFTALGSSSGGKTSGLITASSIQLSGTPTTAGSFTLALTAWLNPNGTGDSLNYNYTVVVSGASGPVPVITAQPLSVTVNSGGTVAFTVTATSATALGYQWRKDGINLSGATGDTLILNGVNGANAGSYTVAVSNSGGSVTSGAATLAVTSGQVSRISNMSVRTNLASGQGLTVGFVTSGAKNLLVRAIGPTLKTIFGVTNFYADPKFSVVSGGVTIDFNDTWNPNLSATFAGVGAFALDPNSTDAALVRSVSGPNTAEISGAGSGLMLVELYDTDAATAPARLTNVSARNQVGTGSDVLVSGFVIDGTAARTLLIRGIGPGLHDHFNIDSSGLLPDPLLEIHQTINGVDTTIASNDNWNPNLATVFSAVGAYLFNAGSKDAALLVTLPPGIYTAQVSGVNSGTGNGVVEVYEVP